jgi:hypothetical protein
MIKYEVFAANTPEQQNRTCRLSGLWSKIDVRASEKRYQNGNNHVLPTLKTAPRVTPTTNHRLSHGPAHAKNLGGRGVGRAYLEKQEQNTLVALHTKSTPAISGFKYPKQSNHVVNKEGPWSSLDHDTGLRSRKSWVQIPAGPPLTPVLISSEKRRRKPTAENTTLILQNQKKKPNNPIHKR